MVNLNTKGKKILLQILDDYNSFFLTLVLFIFIILLFFVPIIIILFGYLMTNNLFDNFDLNELIIIIETISFGSVFNVFLIMPFLITLLNLNSNNVEIWKQSKKSSTYSLFLTHVYAFILKLRISSINSVLFTLSLFVYFYIFMFISWNIGFTFLKDDTKKLLWLGIRTFTFGSCVFWLTLLSLQILFKLFECKNCCKVDTFCGNEDEN